MDTSEFFAPCITNNAYDPNIRLESHGCYNRSIMQHVRPEHDPARWQHESDWIPFLPKSSFKMQGTFTIRGRRKWPPGAFDD